jgi:hypothetical protein
LDRTLEVAADQPTLEEPRLREIARGSLYVAADYSHAISPAAALREELLDRLDLSPRTGDCRLRFDVESIRIPGPNSSVEENRKALAQLHAAWVRYLKDCICAAFNPPCAPCDDPAVLLACLTVKDCEVVDICNLKRKFIISGPALRYWVPPINWLGEVLERLCCPDPICEEEEEAVEAGRSVVDRSGLLRTNTAFGVRQKLPGRVNFGIFQFLCRSVKRTQTFDVPRGSVGTIAPRQSLQNTLGTFAQRIGLPELRLTRTPDIQTRLDTFTDALKNEDIRKLTAEVLKIDPDRAGEAITAIADEKVNEAVEKLTTDAAKDLKEARTLKKKNTELAQRVEELTKKLTELSNQVTKLKEATK